MYSYEWEFIQDLSKDSFMIPDINRSNTTGATSGAGIVYPSETPALIPSVSSFHVAQYLVLCVVFRRLLFVFLFFFILVIVLSVVPFTASDYSFGIFKCLPW